MIDKVLLVDGSNFLHRNLHQPGLKDLEHNGNKTGAIFGFLGSLLRSMKKYPDHYPVIVFDMGRSPRRLALYPNYKGQADRDAERAQVKSEVQHGIRPKDDLVDPFYEQLVHQGDAIKAILRVMKIPVISIRGWEGDDLMAIISRNVNHCTLATDDQDMWQLITPTVSVFRPLAVDKDTGDRGVEIDHKYMIENYGELAPIRQFLLSKVIVGDGSDNIPKCAEGVGGKTASTIASHLVDYELKWSEYVNDPKDFEEDENARAVALWDEMLENVKNSVSPRRFTNMNNGWEQYALNLLLMDLSLIPDDPMVLREFHNQVEVCSDMANFIDVVSILSQYGIKGFDYSLALTITGALKMNIGGAVND